MDDGRQNSRLIRFEAGMQFGIVLQQIQRLYSGGSAAGLSDASLLDRFASERDEDAFAALVARHGPMVLCVCRGLVREQADAEDAFQATFLILARRVRSLRVRGSLGGWLHRVAHRVAVRANVDAARRRSRERLGVQMDAIEARDATTRDPRISELHEAISRLPEAFRRAVVLCDLEGMTQVEAAQALGCGEATLRRRLAGAHERLRIRLRPQGLAGALCPLAMPLVKTEPVPAAWINAAAQTAVEEAAGRAVATCASRLAGAVLGAMARTRYLRFATVLFVGVGAAAAWSVLPGRGAGRAAAAQTKAGADGKSAEAPAKTSGRITGRVIASESGNTAAGADVVLLLPPPKGQKGYGDDFPVRRTAADASGVFSFDNLAPGRYRVWSNLGKLTSLKKDVRGQVVILPESGKAPEPVELRLAAGVAVAVRVKEKATGAPIANATVHLEWTAFRDDAVTGRDGLVQIQPLVASQWLLEVWADGFAKASRRVDLENGLDAEEEFLLGRGGTLEGVVRDRLGKPLAGVWVGASAEGGEEDFDHFRTGADGRYRLSHLPLGFEIQLEISGDDLLAQDVTTQLAGTKQTRDFTMQARPNGGSIAGVVLDQQGQPLAGARVSNMGRSSGMVRETKTGPDGRFRLDDLFENNVGMEVFVRAKGAAPKRVKVKPGPRDQPGEARITLEAGHTVKGRVADEKNVPMAGVQVYFSNLNHGNLDGGMTTTDVRGLFSFDSLPPGAPFAFYKNGYSQINDRRLPLDSDQVVQVVMVPAGVIIGRVFDATTDKPIREFNVQITFSPKRQPGEPSTVLFSGLVNPGQNFHSIDGRFNLANLVVGMPLQVMVSAEGYERRVTERVVVARHDDLRIKEFRLDPVDRAEQRTYHGRLVDARGNPVAAAQLRLFASRDRDPEQRQEFPFNWTMIRTGQLAQQSEVTRFLKSVTDAHGRFEFTRVPKGDEVEIAWWGKGIVPGRSDHLERVDEKAPIEIKLRAGARIIVSIDRKAFADAGQIEVAGSDDFIDGFDGKLKPGQTELVVDDLAPGDYRMFLRGSLERIAGSPEELTTRTALASMDVHVDPGETKRVEFKK
jgi:RNA polymerase sigma factor (sigma-70 family)